MTEYSAMKYREARRQANELLKSIGSQERAKRQIAADRDNAIATLRATYDIELDEIQEQQDAKVDLLLALVLPQPLFVRLAVKGTQMIRLRAGTVKLGPVSSALELGDKEDKIVRRIAGKGGLRSFTRRGKRTLNKEALKQAPDFVAKIKGLRIVIRQQVHVLPTGLSDADIKRPIDPETHQIQQED